MAFSYFKDEPWVDNDGMDYIGGTTYKSKTFYSFSHSFTAIFSVLRKSDLAVETRREFNRDISNSFPYLDSGNMPLSYVLVAPKRRA